MNKELKEMVSKELEQFYCSILLDDVKEKIRRLKNYGVEEADIESVLQEKELLPELIITKDYKIVICNGTHQEVEMEPLVKAVYLLFLKHPEGIVLKYLSDYQDELRNIYLSLRSQGLTEKAERSIGNVVDSTQNSINEKCARIRKAFLSVLPQSIARYYTISGKRGEIKRINLPQGKIKWEAEIPPSQGLQ